SVAIKATAFTRCIKTSPTKLSLNSIALVLGRAEARRAQKRSIFRQPAIAAQYAARLRPTPVTPEQPGRDETDDPRFRSDHCGAMKLLIPPRPHRAGTP